MNNIIKTIIILENNTHLIHSFFFFFNFGFYLQCSVNNNISVTLFLFSFQCDLIFHEMDVFNGIVAPEANINFKRQYSSSSSPTPFGNRKHNFFII